MEFKNLKELEAYLMAQVNDSLHTDVAENTKQLMKQHIETDIYNAYEPSLYVRRAENGGLLDDNNFLIEDIPDGVSITNVTTDDGYSKDYYGDDSSDPNTWLVPIIETGKGYNWTNSKIYEAQQARPFIENTRKDLFHGKAKEYIKNALIKRGLNVK